MASLLDICICILLLTSSFAACDPIPVADSPPSEMSYDMEKKISLLQQEIDTGKEFPLKEEEPLDDIYNMEKRKLSLLQQVDPDKESSRESYKIDNLQDYLQQQEEEEAEKRPSKQSYALAELEKMEAKIQHIEEMIDDDEETPLSEIMQADALSVVTRYVGVGYNLLKGNPEGEFDRGGIDPGILVTKHIFQFTYDQGKQAYYRGSANNVPDQVEFHKFSSCTSSNTLSAYSGEHSYQRQLSVSVEAEASYGDYQFGLSAGMESARAGTEKQNKVNIDKEELCAYGQVRYLVENRNNAAFKVATSFYNAVKRLPQTYSQSTYCEFLNQWGTHILVEADVGTRKISRSYLSYLETYKYLENKGRVGISASGSYLGFSSSFSVNIDTMNEQIDSSSQRSERVQTFSMGTEAEPLPVHMKLKSIADAFVSDYWTDLPSGDTYSSLKVSDKKRNIERALGEYPQYLRLNPATDPLVIIPNAWPDGKYALQSTPNGCPSKWSEGWRYHDTEDSNSNNWWSSNMPNRVRGSYGKNNVKQYYCVKGDSAPNYGLEWPMGSYCIAKYGGGCPEHFREGNIYWDDEDSSNANSKHGVLPDGSYDSNTRIYYCCRNDERPNVAVTLPKGQPFILYRYGGTCQTVAGMNVASEYLRFDCEDSSNNDSCSGDHPDDDGCNENHRIHYCYYY